MASGVTNGEIRLNNKYSLQAKAGYVFRKSNNVDVYLNSENNGITFVNQDLLLNIGLLYSISSKFKAGLGGGFYHKLNSRKITDLGPVGLGTPILSGMSHNILFNSHFQLVYRLYKNINLMTMYQYLYDTELPPNSGILEFEGGHHAFSIGVSYDLVKSKHSK